MRFTTASGAVYDIFTVEGDTYITRDSEIPVVDFFGGGPMEEIHAQRVEFNRPPTVGERFHYFTESHGFAISTAVASVEEEA